MRKNRHNNGYVGKFDLDDLTGGVMSSSKTFLNREDTFDTLEDSSDAEYVRPTNGNGYGATATVALVNGNVTQIYLTNRGTGYSTEPTVTISGGGGSGAEAGATVSGGNVTAITLWHTVSEVIISDKGQGYTSTPTVTFSAPASGGTTATGTAVIENGRLVGITITNAGSRYTSVPTITLSTAGSIKQAVAIPRIVCGTGYTSAPNVAFSGGGGSNAAATAVVTGDLGAFTITAGGSGYTERPTVYLNGTSSDDFIAYAEVSGGAVTSITTNTTKKFSTPTTVKIGGWKPLPSVSDGEQKIVGTFAVHNHDSNFVRFTMSGNYTVDWGDGTSQNVNANVAVQKQYDSASYAAITNQDEFRGYKTVTITITPQAGQNLTFVNLTDRHTSLSSNSNTTNWLDFKIAGNNISTFSSFGASAVPIQFVLLEEVEFIGSFSNSFTSGIRMFLGCTNLNRVKGTEWCKNLTSFSQMFQNCRNLKTIPLLNTSNVTTFIQAFQGCSSLKSIPLLDTSNVTSVSTMFESCSSLKSIPLLNTSKVTNFTSMFSNCVTLTSIPLLNTSSGTIFDTMFNSCLSLKTIPLLDTSSGTSFSSMFSGCRVLKTIPLLNTSNGTAFNSMFASCSLLKTIPLLNTSKGTNFSTMFSSCLSLKTIPLLDTSSGTNFSTMFSSCLSLKTIPLLNTRLGLDFSFMFSNSPCLKTIPLLDTSSGTNFSQMFQNCTALQEIPLLNTSRGTNFGAMFSGCFSLKNIPLLTLTPITGTVTSYQSMFRDTYLVEIPALAFQQTATTTIFNGIFFNCGGLSRIRATGFNQNITLPNPGQLAADELNEIYTNLPTTSRTIIVTGNWGTASDNPAIAIAKGWTVTG